MTLFRFLAFSLVLLASSSLYAQSAKQQAQDLVQQLRNAANTSNVEEIQALLHESTKVDVDGYIAVQRQIHENVDPSQLKRRQQGFLTLRTNRGVAGAGNYVTLTFSNSRPRVDNPKRRQSIYERYVFYRKENTQPLRLVQYDSGPDAFELE
jgi:hypothetical protein